MSISSHPVPASAVYRLVVTLGTSLVEWAQTRAERSELRAQQRRERALLTREHRLAAERRREEVLLEHAQWTHLF
ncbi:hypothetical protein ACFP47_02335 [Nesterenkonia lacusekhoensis]|uniref:Uncharacterized protein n=1 Tax=Nesterenkonia lacusekhoensis TaxID=150832 RepID=A0ABS4T339_9MICC|nr:hypothetical protein [Nesterenkonia lacusekhoensis]MBP2318857.1 hypothetical protein [Nesterenkonia lacusekhoensis]